MIFPMIYYQSCFGKELSARPELWLYGYKKKQKLVEAWWCQNDCLRHCHGSAGFPLKKKKKEN